MAVMLSLTFLYQKRKPLSPAVQGLSLPCASTNGCLCLSEDPLLALLHCDGHLNSPCLCALSQPQGTPSLTVPSPPQ